jgi:hypothetical protein
MTRRVCVCVDESPASHRALSWALDYVTQDDQLTLVTGTAHSHDAELPMTSSLSPPRITSPLPVEDDDDEYDDNDQDVDRSMPEASPEELLLVDAKLMALQDGKVTITHRGARRVCASC